MSLRQRWLALAMVATVAAVYWASRQQMEPSVVMSVKPGPTRSPATASAVTRAAPAQGSVLQIKPRSSVSDATLDAFPAASWIESASGGPVKPSVTAPPVPQPDLQPMAPPLPFKLLGRYQDEGQPPAVFLQFNDQNLVVREGDVIAEQYKVEGLDDKTLTLLHLPTGQRQTMNIGTAP